MDTTTGNFFAFAARIDWRIRSEARTDPPGLSTRITSAFSRSEASPWSITSATLSPPAVPGAASPSTMVPAIVTTPIGALSSCSTTSSM
jgi:hypothetical protein